MYRVQYQGLAEPVSQDSEQIELSKWKGVEPVVTRLPLFEEAVFAASLFFVPLVATATIPDISTWGFKQSSQVDRVRDTRYSYPYLSWDTETLSAIGESITLDKWYSRLSEPVRVEPRTTYYPPFEIDSNLLTQLEGISLDKWYIELDRPTLPKFNPYYYPSYENRVDLDVAFTSLPIKYLSRALGGGLATTLTPNGNTLQVSVVTNIPTGVPPGGKGVVFYINGGVLTIYVWDPVTAGWVSQ